MTDAQRQPYADRILKQVLAAGLGDVNVFTERPPELLKHLPCVVVSTEPAALTASLPRIDPRFGARPMIQVRAYATDRAAAGELAMDARTAFVNAWLKARVVEAGSVNRVDVLAEPAQEDDESLPDGVTCFTGNYALILRPTRGA